jgi:hypothetical protein
MTNNDTPSVSAEPVFSRGDKELSGVINGVMVWIDYDDVDRDEADKVAALIASAPALLAANAALQARLADVERYHGEAVQREVALREQVARMEAEITTARDLLDRSLEHFDDYWPDPLFDEIAEFVNPTPARAGGEV